MNFAQRRALGDPVVAGGGVELGIQVRLAQTGIVQVEHARARPLQQAKRIDVRDQMAAVAVDLYQPRYGGLLFAGHAVGDGRPRAPPRRPGFGRRPPRLPGRVRAHRPARGQPIEVAAPAGVQRSGIAQVLFVQCLDEGGIGIGKRRRIRGFWHG